jgi:Mrp family chromosome partitioning ATPase/capsular polysaccharide biosynthesis protein
MMAVYDVHGRILQSMNETPDATALFAPIWRRKWLILAVGILVAVATYFYYKRERPVYQTSTQVYLGAASEEQVPGEKGAVKLHSVSAPAQATLINSIVVEQVHHRLRAEHKNALAHGSKVRANSAEKSEFIKIFTEAHSARGAALLANLTAQTYIRRQSADRRRAIEAAIAISRRQLLRIEAANTPTVAPKASSSAGKGSGSTSTTTSSSPSSASILQAANLKTKINQLEASLSTPAAQQVNPARASSALLVSPKPKKDAIFGFIIGILLAAIAAYVFSRFDRRLRSLAGIESNLLAPILTALPKVGQPIIRRQGPPRPSAMLLEPLRRLHTGLRPVDKPEADPSLGSRGRVILFTSPDPGDGKSTLVANLALVTRDAGEQAVIVEANFRRPVQGRLLDLQGEHGLSDVLAGGVALEDAMQRVLPLAAAPGAHAPETTEAVTTAVHARAGSLFVLTGGNSVPNPPALLGQEATADLLHSLAEEFDYVLIDAPSPLEVSDVIPLLGVVGGIVIVARVGHTRETSAQRLRQLLDRPSYAPVLGVAANIVAPSDLRRYGFSTPDGRVWSGRR